MGRTAPPVCPMSTGPRDFQCRPQLRKAYPGGIVDVEDFDLSVWRGEFMSFVGPSDCGKTTTLRMIPAHSAKLTRRHGPRRFGAASSSSTPPSTAVALPVRPLPEPGPMLPSGRSGAQRYRDRRHQMMSDRACVRVTGRDSCPGCCRYGSADGSTRPNRTSDSAGSIRPRLSLTTRMLRISMHHDAGTIAWPSTSRCIAASAHVSVSSGKHHVAVIEASRTNGIRGGAPDHGPT